LIGCNGGTQYYKLLKSLLDRHLGKKLIIKLTQNRSWDIRMLGYSIGRREKKDGGVFFLLYRGDTKDKICSGRMNFHKGSLHLSFP
jgi:hypothetical protein